MALHPMDTHAIEVNSLGKRFQLGLTHAGSIRELANGLFRKATRRPTSQTSGASEFWALQELSFCVPQGTAVGVIGHNGAGKSTLLKILSRITPPTTGRVELVGRVASLLEVGTGFHPELTGRENIFLNGTILGMTRLEIRQRLDAIVDFAGVSKFLDTPVKRYSSGMYVRLAFAVAAHLRSEILIVDEVLAVGDAEFQSRCLGKMREVTARGRTVLFVSHNMAAVRQLTQQCLVLNKGRGVFFGETELAVAAYLDLADSKACYDNLDPHRLGDSTQREAEFSSLRFNSRDPQFECDEPIRFSVDLVSRSFTGQARMSLTLYRTDGTAVGSTFSPSEVDLREHGDPVEMRLTLADHRLAPGRYHLALSLGTGNADTGYRDFDTVRDLLHFEILPRRSDEGTIESWSSQWGAIRLPAPQLECIHKNAVTER